MIKSIFKPIVSFLIVLVPGIVLGQQTVIKGKVTDANTGDPIPFVNVVFLGTTVGNITDFEGNFEIKTSSPNDTLMASYIGYRPKKKKVARGIAQVIDFQLEEDVINLGEVVFEAGENPAFDVLRKVIRNKNNNDKRKLTAYEYDTYTKIEIDVDNISEKFRQRKVVKKITQVLDSVERLAGEDGKPILPMFISESVSKLYYRDNPMLKYENILKSKINGVGIEDGTLITQLIGSSFQEYNFYQNWLNIVTKEFVSPIADGWRLYYDYDLTDSLDVGGHFCYRLDFFPRSPQELAFTGTMWITKAEFALKQIDVTVSKKANLNFIEKIKIQQELEPVEGGAWVPVKNRVLIDIAEINQRMAGMLAKFYTSNKNVVVNKPYSPSFYSQPIVMAEDAREFEEEKYWDTLRHEPLSETEKSVYQMIDTLQNIPVVRTYTDIVKIAVNGYYKAGKFFLGPYLALLAVNNIEGVRVQGGIKTNIDFSNKWVLGGSFGYGFKDEKIKYSAFATRILSRERWTTLTLSTRRDIARVGVDEEALSDNYLFLAAQRFGYFRKGYYFDETKLRFQRELFKGFSQRLAFRYWTFDPTFDFGYYAQPNDVSSPINSTFSSSEFIWESRYARDELFIRDDNDRFGLGAEKWPVITLRYTHGFKGVLGSDFDYDKVRLSVYKKLRFGAFGVGYVNMVGEYNFNVLPYPLLTMHLGNQSPIYSSVTFNLMNYGEFASDRTAVLQYNHHFEGFLLNRIPLIRRLKWRLVGTSNVLFGGLGIENKKIIASNTIAPLQSPLSIGNLDPRKPYIEVGYGVENIFKFLRVDFVHRLTYLKKQDARPFGILFSFQFDL